MSPSGGMARLLSGLQSLYWDLHVMASAWNCSSNLSLWLQGTELRAIAASLPMVCLLFLDVFLDSSLECSTFLGAETIFSLLALHQFLFPSYVPLAPGKTEWKFEMTLILEKWLLTSDLGHAYFEKKKKILKALRYDTCTECEAKKRKLP